MNSYRFPNIGYWQKKFRIFDFCLNHIWDRTRPANSLQIETIIGNGENFTALFRIARVRQGPAWGIMPKRLNRISAWWQGVGGGWVKLCIRLGNHFAGCWVLDTGCWMKTMHAGSSKSISKSGSLSSFSNTMRFLRQRILCKTINDGCLILDAGWKSGRQFKTLDARSGSGMTEQGRWKEDLGVRFCRLTVLWKAPSKTIGHEGLEEKLARADAFLRVLRDLRGSSCCS